MIGLQYFRRLEVKSVVMLFSFLFAKAAAFLGPLWIANNSNISFYGAVEFYLGLGVWLAMAIGLGVAGAIPIQIIKNKNSYINELSTVLLFIVGCIAICITMFIYFQDLNDLYVLLAVIVFFSLAQQILSPLLKSQIVSAASPWLDNLAVHIVVISGILLCFFYGGEVDRKIVNVMLLLFLCFFVIFFAFLYKFLDFDLAVLSKVYIESVKIGFPVLLNGLIMIYIFNSGRLIIGFFYTTAEVAAYSYVFRIFGVSLIAYQFFTLIFFKDIYALSNRKISKKIMNLMCIVALISLFSCSALFSFSDDLIPSALLKLGVLDLVPLIAVQVNLWILSALLETRINTQGLTNKSARLCVIPAVVLLILFYLVSALNVSSIYLACSILCLVGVITVIAQVYILNLNNPLPLRTRAAVVFSISPIVFVFG